jgi:hypothetical protein
LVADSGKAGDYRYSPLHTGALTTPIGREKLRQSKLVEAKAALLEEMKGKLSALGLSLNDVIPSLEHRSDLRVAYGGLTKRLLGWPTP